MRCVHNDFEFEISDEWLAEAGLIGFVPSHQSYLADHQAFRDIFEVRIADVAPVRRNLSCGVFNDDADTRLTAKERCMKILRGFANGDAIPPVLIVKQNPDTRYLYRLTHGAHRFYLSIGAGFTHVPAVFDPLE
jgi:hypothetical protein